MKQESHKPYNKKLLVEIEVEVTHRDESSIMHISDPNDRPWRSIVRHSNGSVQWEWHKTRQQAIDWCDKFTNFKPLESSQSKKKSLSYEVAKSDLQFCSPWAVYPKGGKSSICYCTDEIRAKLIADAVTAYVNPH